MRVFTVASSTCEAGTQPVVPFGRFGIWTRYERGLHLESTICPRTEKIVGTPFTFSRPNRAKIRPPGLCETVARSRTIAA
jgi:hypothetical protein